MVAGIVELRFYVLAARVEGDQPRRHDRLGGKVIDLDIGFFSISMDDM